MAVNDKRGADTRIQSLQEILNQSFDQFFQTLVMQNLGYDGRSLQRALADAIALKVLRSGSDTYVAVAAPGSADADAVWQCKKVHDDGVGTTRVTWADGNIDFDNIATDLTALTYI